MESSCLRHDTDLLPYTDLHVTRLLYLQINWIQNLCNLNTAVTVLIRLLIKLTTYSDKLFYLELIFDNLSTQIKIFLCLDREFYLVHVSIETHQGQNKENIYHGQMLSKIAPPPLHRYVLTSPSHPSLLVNYTLHDFNSKYFCT